MSTFCVVFFVNCIKMAFRKVRQYTTTEGKTYIEEIDMVDRPDTLTIKVKEMEDSVNLGTCILLHTNRCIRYHNNQTN